MRCTLADPVRILETRLPGTRVRTWLVDFPAAFDRPGNPYQNALGHDWHDNASRFSILSRVAVAVALGIPRLRWKPDIVHAHDWQCGLVPALLAPHQTRPATVFTIHNLAYQGLFSYETFLSLALPPALWNFSALEFHGQLSFIKGGITFADRVTTVSPTYAQEICSPDFGYGLEGALRHRGNALRGILNGIDVRQWNPRRDALITTRYSPGRLASGKTSNKEALQSQLGLARSAKAPLAGIVSRLVEQKGVDLVIEAIPMLIQHGVQFAILGSGEARLEDALRTLAKNHPEQVAVVTRYDESLAHRIIAGSDLFIVPSRFEPCGLTQLYSLQYGTIPVVRRTGGLADTVVDASASSLAEGTATGILFEQPNSAELANAVSRAMSLFRQRRLWNALRRRAMAQDFSWKTRAREYQSLYDELSPSAATRQLTPTAPDTHPESR